MLEVTRCGGLESGVTAEATDTPGKGSQRVFRGDDRGARQRLLGNRYTRISPKFGSQGVLRLGELESGVRLPRTTMVARQPIRSDFTEMGFSGLLRRGELESGVRLPRTTMVARQPIHTDFTEIGFPGDLRHGELESAVRLARMRMVDREPMKIEFPGNKFS